MPDYLLDTNILRYWYDDRCPEHHKVASHIQAVRQPDRQSQYMPRLFISVVTLGEIEYGHRSQQPPDAAKQAAYIAFVRGQCPDPLELSKHVAAQYGELKAWLFNNCSPKERRAPAKRPEQLIDPIQGRELAIDENDLWITAHAMTHGLVLVTHDSRGNFGRLLHQFSSTLQVEDWAR